MATISIIMPVYNAARYLPYALDSIVKQSFSDYEVLLINDGSTDSSGDICEEYCARDSRFLVFHVINEGVSHARNLGLSLSTGKYLFFCDADDMIHPYTLQVLYDKMVQEDSDMCFSNRIFINNDEEADSISLENFSCTRYRGDDELCRLYAEHPECFTVVWGKLYKASLVKQQELQFDERISRGEDVLFICSFLSILCQKVVFIDVPLYYYRKVEGSLSRLKDSTLTVQCLDAFLSYNKVICNKKTNSRLSHLIKNAIGTSVINSILYTNNGIKCVFYNLRAIYFNHVFMSFIKKNKCEFTNSQRFFVYLISYIPLSLVALLIRLYQNIK